MNSKNAPEFKKYKIASRLTVLKSPNPSPADEKWGKCTKEIMENSISLTKGQKYKNKR